MKLNDFIFDYQTSPRNCGLCRVRSFINQEGELYVVVSDLGELNPGASVTNCIEVIYESLLEQGLIDEKYKIIEHYEKDSFDIVVFDQDNFPSWNTIAFERLCLILDVEKEEFDKGAISDKKLLITIDKKRKRMNPLMDYPYLENPQIIKRRLEIEQNRINKSELETLVLNGAKENELLRVLKKDLSIFAEIYANPKEEYICFSEFQIGDGGQVDFAVFSSRSRMEVTLIEVKCAEFTLLVKRDGYKNILSRKIDIAISQIKKRAGYVYRNYEEFRKKMHQIREQVENGEQLYNSFIGPKGCLQVDRNKDINIRYVVIGGRTNEDLLESSIRQDYQIDKPQIYIETWDSFIRRLSRF